MIPKRLDRLSIAAAVAVAVLVLAACAIQLRGGEEHNQSAASAPTESDPTAAKLEQCRTITVEQKDALLECRKIWAEKRRQFLGSKSETSAQTGTRTLDSKSSEAAPPKDETHLPPGNPNSPMPGRQ